MKTILILAITSFAVVSTVSIETNAPDKANDLAKENVVIVFTRKQDFNELVKLKLDQSDKGITLKFRKLVFDDFGKLTEISFNVDCNDGFAGSAGAKLTITPFGFYRKFDNEDSPFGTGDMSDHVRKPSPENEPDP